MNFYDTLSLIMIMLALAALPSASVALVITRSASHGVHHGYAVSGGIVIGDLIFITLALLGMSTLATTMGSLFAIFRYLGAAYLIWIGIGLIRSRGEVNLQSDTPKKGSLTMSFTSGIFLTLGDLKAILFYASLFPTFINLQELAAINVMTIIIVTIITIGSVKIIYAYSARKILSRIQNQRTLKAFRLTTGSLLVGAGGYLFSKS